MTEAPEVRAPQSHERWRLASSCCHCRPDRQKRCPPLAGRYEHALQAGLSLADLSYTAGARRDHHDYRLAVVGRDAAELSESLAAYRQGETPARTDGRTPPSRDRASYSSSPGRDPSGAAWDSNCTPRKTVFRDALAECDRAIRPHLESSVIDELLAGDSLDDIGVIQPAIFADAGRAGGAVAVVGSGARRGDRAQHG